MTLQAIPTFDMRQNSGHTEPLTTEEIEYLSISAHKQHKQYMKSSTFIVGAATVFFGALIVFAYLTFDPHKVYQEYEIPLSPDIALSIGLGTLALICPILLLTYRLHISPLFKEIREGNKIIEQARIVRKKHMPHNQSFHFYLNSRTLKTIEINQRTFDLYQINDEINVEYTPRSLKALGYY